MLAFNTAPRQEHLQALFHIFAYLPKHDRSSLVFDDGYIKITDEVDSDWTSFYPDSKEHIPTNMPEPRGKPVQMICFLMLITLVTELRDVRELVYYYI
jgi:hypothetical protein